MTEKPPTMGDLAYLLAESRRMRDDRRHLAYMVRLLARIEHEVAQVAPRVTPDVIGRTRRNKGLEHGTESGYSWHRNHGLPFPEDEGGLPCGCRRGHNVAEQRRRLRRLEAEREREQLTIYDFLKGA